MRIRFIPLALSAAFVEISGGVHAQELPPPRIIVPSPGMTRPVLPPPYRPGPVLPLAASPYPPPGYQPSAYQVWQNYTVAFGGWLLPRVIQTPQGGYFLYNGAPFPYSYALPGLHQGMSLGPAAAPAP